VQVELHPVEQEPVISEVVQLGVDKQLYVPPVDEQQHLE